MNSKRNARRVSRRAVVLCLLGFIAVLLVLLFLFHRPILVSAAYFLIQEDALEQADLIVVMSGGLPDIHYGIDLHKEGYAGKLLFLGHFPVELMVLSEEPFKVVEKSWDEVAANLAIGSGVDPQNIYYSEAFNTSTYQRVESFLEGARKHGSGSVIVVGHPVHSGRVVFSALKILEGSPPRIISAPTPARYFPEAYRFDPESWWTDEAQMRSVFGEYIRTIYYWLKYGPS